MPNKSAGGSSTLDMPLLNALRVFCAAGQASSVGKAAERLGITSSAVSQQIKNLEDWLRYAVV